MDHGKPSIKPERCGHGQTQESGAISDWATNHLDAPSMAYTDSDLAANREDRRSVRWRDACPQWRTLEILVKKAEGGVAFVVGERAIRCGINWNGGSRSPKWDSKTSGTTRV